MNAQDIMMASRLTRVRELQTQLAKAAEENSRLAAENAELKAHFDLALLAAEDLRALPADGRLIIIDGWNIVLGDTRRATRQLRFAAREPQALVAEAKAYLEAHPHDFVWIVFDGPRENVKTEGRLRISYTGGVGAHRADRFICDFLRMAKFTGSLERICVETRDRDMVREVDKLTGGAR